MLQIWTAEADKINHGVRFFLIAGTSTLLAYVNWLGLSVVGNMSILICILSMSPFLIMSIIGFFQLDVGQWFEMPETEMDGGEFWGDDMTNTTSTASMSDIAAFGASGILWRPYLNNLFWNLNSFDSAASFAGDVEDPGKTMPKAMLLSCLMVAFGYLIPLMAALGATDSSQHDWVDGYLATAASQIGGPWLGDWVVFAAGVSNIALFQAELSADALQLMGMSERGFVPKIFSIRSRHGTPTYGILLGLLVIICMGSFNLDKLIEMLNFNYSISLLVEYCAFIKLRISKPDGEFLFQILMCWTQQESDDF
jgi:amino acid transporter